jgi:anti-sigma regulatory factor (Ser/Thr protein kinase)
MRGWWGEHYRQKQRRTNVSKKAWENYENVARHLLNQLASHFGLGHVEGKQIVSGVSEAEWAIDAKGVLADGDGFVIVECRRYIKKRLNQESVGAVAFRIKDTGAAGAFIVSPLDLQSGAKKVAMHSNIVHIKLDPSSTTTDYLMKFLQNIFVGIGDSVAIGDTVIAEVRRDGKLIY